MGLENRMTLKYQFMDESLAIKAEGELNKIEPFCERYERFGSAMLVKDIYNMNSCVNYFHNFSAYTTDLTEWDKKEH